jgi:cysteine-rich repeat protein
MGPRALLWHVFVLAAIVGLNAQVQTNGGGTTTISSDAATFQVALFYNVSVSERVHRCTGTLLTDDWVVTSATCLCSGVRSTCLDQIAQWQAVFDTNLQAAATTAQLAISRIEIHPNWTGNALDGFDVALFRLAGSARSVRANARAAVLATVPEWNCATGLGKNVAVYAYSQANQLVMATGSIVSDLRVLDLRAEVNNLMNKVERDLTNLMCLKNSNCLPYSLGFNFSDARLGLCPTDLGAPLILNTDNQFVLLGLASSRFTGSLVTSDTVNLPCVENFNGVRLPFVFSQLDRAQDWIRNFVVNTTTFGSRCGDGLIGPQEECDDGNSNSGDGCNSTCMVEGPAWHCLFSRVDYSVRSDNDDHRHGSVFHYNSDIDICTRTVCGVLDYNQHDDDGSSGSIIALIIVLSILGGLLLIALVVCCIMRRKKKSRNAVVEEPMNVLPMAPMATMPASPLMEAPPSTPMDVVMVEPVVMSPVPLEIVSPTFGAPAPSEVLEPIVTQEQILEAPRVEATSEMAPPTWLKE